MILENMSKFVEFKCRKCRRVLLDDREVTVVSGHNLKIDENSIHHPSSEINCQDTIDSLYLREEGLPQWIAASLDEAGWQKGKLKCPNCAARLGSFDFVSGRKCHCQQFILPPVHIIKSKIDHQTVEMDEKT